MQNEVKGSLCESPRSAEGRYNAVGVQCRETFGRPSSSDSRHHKEKISIRDELSNGFGIKN